MHSIGRVLGSPASKGLSKGEREKEGKQGGMVHLVYICALAAEEEVSLWDATRGPEA
jgi:hypothetical protein